MLKIIREWLKIYQDEISLFLWSALLLFLIRSSNVLLNNYAETAFLKRFGVEYLPMMYMVNSIGTFFIMGMLTGIMGRVSGAKLLSNMLFFCGGTIAAFRFLIPTGIDFLYPVIFVMKTQYEILLALLFWNLANDLFNTRQSKRIFPLLTAGGVLGAVIGSFSTPFLARLSSFDNLMLVYFGITGLGALAVRAMGMAYPSLLIAEKRPKKTKRSLGIKKEIQKVIPLLKESKLLRILILLTLLPNLVIPILNYQFNFAVDQTFATESKMLQFFGYFRGSLNVVSFFILFFVSRLYSRFGIPIALMFHPINYALAFMAFFLRFDVVSAIYARISTNIIRTTINNPARAVLMGLFPSKDRGIVRPFLRGTVVRIATLTGSGIVMITDQIMHPKYLSLIALVFVGGWILSTIFFKRQYSKILLEVVSGEILDLKALDEKELAQIFGDKGTQNQLIQGFLNAKGEEIRWYAALLKSIGVKDLDRHILTAIREANHSPDIKIGLISELSPNAGKEAVEVLRSLAAEADRDLLLNIVEVAGRFSPQQTAQFLQELYEKTGDSEIKGYCVRALYSSNTLLYRKVVEQWLSSGDLLKRRAGIIAAAGSKDSIFVQKLIGLLDHETEPENIALILESLDELQAKELIQIAPRYFSHTSEEVRLSALKAFQIQDDESLRLVMGLLDDSSEKVRDLAKSKIMQAPYQNTQTMIQHLATPKRKIRDGVFEILDTQGIKDVDVYRFARSSLKEAYMNLVALMALENFPEDPYRNLLMEHLRQRKNVLVENVLRILAVQDNTGKMKIVYRGLFSGDARERANSMELLEDTVERSLAKILTPLLEATSLSRALEAGRKKFSLPEFGPDAKGLFAYLLGQDDWLTVLLTINLIGTGDLYALDTNLLQELENSKNSFVRNAIKSLRKQGDEMNNDTGISLVDKIIHLKGIEIFEGLSVNELAAVASVTEETFYPAGQVVIKEGEKGDTLYMIIEGEVSVWKRGEKEKDIRLDTIGAGDYFGEMALFEDQERSATIRTEKESRFLVLKKQDFTEIVREYPEIALHICKVLGRRIRKLHETLKSCELRASECR